MFYDMKHEVRAQNEIENVYTLCGVDENGKMLCVVTNYSDDDSLGNKKVALDIGRCGKFEIYRVDSTHDGELCETTEKLEFDMENQSFILVKEI